MGGGNCEEVGKVGKMTLMTGLMGCTEKTDENNNIGR
jgi:hypothetical protein